MKGKEALILDLAGISHELGLPDEVRAWSLEDGEMREPKKAHTPPPRLPALLHGVLRAGLSRMPAR